MTEKDIRKKLGEKARKLRRAAKKTQKEIAEEIGIYQNDLSAFENHGNKLGLDKINELFDYFGYEINVSEKKTTLISA